MYAGASCAAAKDATTPPPQNLRPRPVTMTERAESVIPGSCHRTGELAGGVEVEGVWLRRVC